MRRLNRSVSARNGQTRSGGEARSTERVTTIARIRPRLSRATIADVSSPSDPPPPHRPREADLGPTPLPLALELPSEVPKARARAVADAADAARRDRQTGRTRRWIVGIAAALVVLAAAALALALWVLPWYVRRACVAEAAAHGIALSVDGAELGAGGFRLVGVHATAAAMPGAHAQAPEIEVETSGLRPERMTVRRAEVTLNGSWRTVETALASWRASSQGGQGG